jgi:SagB-type dehydrogenase family enzyme
MIIARLRKHDLMANLWPYLRMIGRAHEPAAAALVERLSGDGVALDDEGAAADLALTDTLAGVGFVEFHAGRDNGKIVLTPSAPNFTLRPGRYDDGTRWQLSRFTYMHVEGGNFVVRHPVSDCFLIVNDQDAQRLALGLRAPGFLPRLEAGGWSSEHAGDISWMLARAGAIVPVEADGRPLEAKDAKLRQWDFHDLLFHTSSRLGRTEKPIGGTFSFNGDIAPTPALKRNVWIERMLSLPRPDIAALSRYDMPLTAAIETRRSIRQYSIVPPSIAQLGEFLYRTVRTRSLTPSPMGEFVSRPHANGGACYEQEYYITIDACLDFPRGFYYYDSVHHGVCLISGPHAEMEALLDEASVATARQGRPQILVTIASRFHRVGWKYRGMGYATQLKNIGAIYQTMYLVATAMNLAGCGLGIGNTDRFCRMTGLDYLEEGSIGEFMLGRPL